MSTIEKLSIQGIRSFGTKSEDVQSISFSHPLTLILGKNGCGKTTIIECLKYALTGETPPGSNRGQSFIHDPKIFDYSESLGQIKLMVRNILEEHVTVCRSMKITHKRGKPSFETLDTSMIYMSTNRSKSDSVSKRCVDVDVAMCQFMGVSRAILNNVVFCHQEDSSWPLEEAKKLKEKFDAIFGITEYNKAIERIVKIRKQYLDDFKLKESNLRLLAHLKQEMEVKEITIQKEQEKLNYLKESSTRCDIETKAVDDRLAAIKQVECEVGKYQSVKVELETKGENFHEQITTLRQKIKKYFTGDINELDNEIQRFDKKMFDRNIERHKVEIELSELKAEEKCLQQVVIDLDKKISSVIQDRKKEQEFNADRAEKIHVLCEQLQINLNKVDYEDEADDITDILKEIENSLLKEQCKIAEATFGYEKKDQLCQAEIDTFRVDLTRIEEGLVALKKNKEQLEKEYSAIELKITEAEISTNRLSKICEDVERINKCYEEFSTNLKQDELKQTISKGKAKVVNLQENFRKLDERLMFLNSITKVIAEISLREEELYKKNQEVQRLKCKHSDNLKIIFDQPLNSKYRYNLQQAYEKLRWQVRETSEKTNILKLQKQSLEIKRKQLKDDILYTEKEIQISKDKVYEKCHLIPYDILISKCKESVSKYQLEYGALRSAEAMYKKYIKKIEEYPYCPLCHKGISRDEAASLTADLSDEINSLPTNIDAAEKQLKAEQQKYEDLLQIKSIIDQITHLEINIPKRKEEFMEIEQQLADCGNTSEFSDLMFVELNAKFELVNSMLGDMSLLDEAIKDAEHLQGEIFKLKEKISQESYTGASIEELQFEKCAVSAELENERKCLEKLQVDYEDGTDALNKLREKRNKLKDEQIMLQEGIQSLPQLQGRKIEVSNMIKIKLKEIYDLQSKVLPLQQKLNAAIEKKTALKEINRKHVANLQLKYDSYKKTYHDIQRLNTNLNEYKIFNLRAEVERLKESIKHNQHELDEKSIVILKMSETLDTIKSECINQENLERNLKDNRELMILQQKKINIDKQLQKISKVLVDLDFCNISKEKSELIRKRNDATVRKGELLGQIGEINKQISKLKGEINESKYKDSLKNYRRSLYDVNITNEIIADMGKYRIALERALLQFHAEKMEKINRLIREYWRQIYRGNDIDYIEIQNEEGKLESSADRKRNYNYRVVQAKNNSEIDMRGRCSAGQRVLASLIIRMALAETFSSNCGVLALDEPTSNLDQPNILSLCEALNKIVYDRKAQSNFMLIIITHDENFISHLGKISTYHSVFRNDDGKSIIRKVKVT